LLSSSIVISLSLTKYHLSLSLVIITFVNFAVSAPILTSKLPVPLPYLLFTRNLITATLCIIYNLPKSKRNRLQVIQNSLALAVVKAPKFCHVTPILKSLYWLKINERIEYKLLSLTYKALITAQPTYLHSLISVQPLPCATRSSSVVTLSRPPTSSPIARFAMHHLITGINFLSHSFSLAQNTLRMMSHSLIHLPPTHHSHPPSHIHCFIPGSKLIFSTNLFHQNLLAPT